jgi:hypothetical protein
VTGGLVVAGSVTAVATASLPGAALSYAWYREGKPEAVGTDASYTPVVADQGKALTVVVTAVADGYNDASAQLTTAVVGLGTFTIGEVSFDPEEPVVGEPVTVSAEIPAGIDDADVEYVWFSNGVAVGSGATYIPVPADLGEELTVRVVAEADGYVVSLKTVDLGNEVIAGSFAVSEPVISGDPAVGEELTASVELTPAVPAANLTFTWYYEGETDPIGTGPVYTPGPEDAGKALTVVVTATAAGYDSPAPVTSDPTDTVEPGTLSVGAISLTPAPKVDVTSTAVVAGLPAGASVTYTWKVGGVTVATGDSFTPNASQAGQDVTVAATVSLDGYAATEKTSSATISQGALNVSAPLVTGSLVVAGSVTAEATPSVAADLSYAWYREGVTEAVASGATYTPVVADQGKKLTVKVTAVAAGYSQATNQTTTTQVGLGTIAIGAASFSPAVPVVGQTVTISAPTVPAGATVTYTWFRGQEAVASGNSYTPNAADLGGSLTVKIVAQATGYAVALADATTQAVAIGTLTVTNPVVSGPMVVGGQLTASATAAPNVPGLTLAFAWYREGVTDAIATGTTYTAVAADLGKKLTVSVAATAGGYRTATGSTTIASVIAPATLSVGALTVSPTLAVGVDSTATVAGLPAGASVAYTWRIDGSTVGTGAVFRPTSAQAGKTVTVTAVVSLAGYNSETRTYSGTIGDDPTVRINNYTSMALSPDMTGDALGEIVAVHRQGDVHLYPATADKTGNLQARRVVETGVGNVRILAPGDINTDGKADLVYIDQAGDLWLKAGDGRGGVASTRQKIGNGWTGWRAIPAGDLNGDGKADLLGIDDSTGLLYMYAGLGNGTFATKRQVGNGWIGFELYSAGDLNGDRRIDILSIDSAGILRAYMGNGNGTFATKKQVGNGWTGFTLASGADLTGDAFADIVGRNDTDGELYIYKGKGSGLFETKRAIGHDW